MMREPPHRLSLRAINSTKLVCHYGPVGWGEAELIP